MPVAKKPPTPSKAEVDAKIAAHIRKQAGAPQPQLDLAKLTGLEDAALISALRDLIDGHKALTWRQARHTVILAIDNTGGQVTDAYTGRTVPIQGVPEASEMNANIEHTMPRSKLKETPGESDLHHLFLADIEANSLRANHPFGVVTDVLWARGGAKFGTDSRGKTVFEPPDWHKGNVARAMFYVATRYGLKIPRGEEGLLKRWHKLDPVDGAERRRNELVSRYQGNRNPFIDAPALPSRIKDF